MLLASTTVAIYEVSLQPTVDFFEAAVRAHEAGAFYYTSTSGSTSKDGLLVQLLTPSGANILRSSVLAVRLGVGEGHPEATTICFGVTLDKKRHPAAKWKGASWDDSQDSFVCYYRRQFPAGGHHTVRLMSLPPRHYFGFCQAYDALGHPAGPLSRAVFSIDAVGAGARHALEHACLEVAEGAATGDQAWALAKSCRLPSAIVFASPEQGFVGRSGDQINVTMTLPFAASSTLGVHAPDNSPWTLKLYRGEGVNATGASSVLLATLSEPATLQTVMVSLPAGLHALSAIALPSSSDGQESIAGPVATVFVRILAPNDAGVPSVDHQRDGVDKLTMHDRLRNVVGAFEEMGGSYDTPQKTATLAALAASLPRARSDGSACVRLPPKFCHMFIQINSLYFFLQARHACAKSGLTPVIVQPLYWPRTQRPL
jgi:hypothetical protein